METGSFFGICALELQHEYRLERQFSGAIDVFGVVRLMLVDEAPLFGGSFARQVKIVLKSGPGTSSAYAEHVMGGYYLEILPDRAQLARYGLTISGL